MRARNATRALVCALVALAACADEPISESHGVLRGRVVDAMTGQAIADARVRVEGTELEAVTDESGHYELFAPTGGHALHVAADGYFGLTRQDVVIRALEETESDVAIYAERPEEAAVEAHMERRALRHLLRDDPSDPALRPEAAAFLRGELDLTGHVDHDHPEIGGARAALGAPPATVRIWRRSIDGAAASCSGRIDVIPLEDYIKGVLPHEWIPSWEDESLKAGSLAIRTYVWNWVSRGGKYDCADLDDTTRSQVYRDDRMDVTNRAVDATTGKAIVAGDTLVSGEYSAENGSPTALGVSDPLCAGRALYGHGRGMCQWGSQRWALDGKDHLWIATHYYPGSSIAGGGPTLPAYDAVLAGVDHPAELVSGERAVVWVEMRNTGATTWDLTGTWLGTTGPRDRASAFYDTENWLNDHRATAPDHSEYSTDTIGRFTFMVTAPAVTETTTVTETFGLVQEGVSWFGPEDITISIVVHPAEGTMPTEPGPGGGTTEPTTPGEEPAPTPGGGTTDPDPPSAPGAPPPGGGVSGGCSATGATSSTPLPFLALGVFALAALRRRRR